VTARRSPPRRFIGTFAPPGTDTAGVPSSQHSIATRCAPRRWHRLFFLCRALPAITPCLQFTSCRIQAQRHCLPTSQLHLHRARFGTLLAASHGCLFALWRTSFHGIVVAYLLSPLMPASAFHLRIRSHLCCLAFTAAYGFHAALLICVVAEIRLRFAKSAMPRLVSLYMHHAFWTGLTAHAERNRRSWRYHKHLRQRTLAHKLARMRVRDLLNIS